jgi:glycosyltransferase involved in cell wall biosynthesis/LmbE family N-acetylglucosaminyl deacetylase
MHICFPSLSYPLNGEPASGVGSQVRLLGHALAEAGHSISVVDLASEPNVITDAPGINVYRVCAGKLHWFAGKLPLVGKSLSVPLREIEYSYAVWRGVKQSHRARKVELIEGTETGMLLLALFWKHSPIVIRLHGEQYTFEKYTPEMRLKPGVRLSRVLQRIALRRAKLLISPSDAHAREIRAELGPARPPIAIVPNTVATHEEHNGQERSKIVLYAGRIDKRKGVTTLLRAAAQTTSAIPGSRFVFAGDFHSSLPRAEFEQLVRANQLEDKVYLLGPVGWTTLKRWYKEVAAVVLPSYYEAFGLAALEPMAFGTPVIASNSSALPEIVEPEKCGKLVQTGDADALASAMTELLSDPAKCARMGKAAIERAARFDVRNLLPLTQRLYEWCVDDSASEEIHIFFSPHPDDVALSCGGAAQSLVSKKKAVQVITVFSGDSGNEISAFARHLYSKWGTLTEAEKQRREEDREALRRLGVQDIEYWDYADSPARQMTNGTPLYATYDEMKSDLVVEDAALVDLLARRILNLKVSSHSAVLYFPLALGNHVDHRILFTVGCRAAAAGKSVRFYEDYPYAEEFENDCHELNWLPRRVSVSAETKLDALSAYHTQIPGLGGSLQNARKRLRRFSIRLNGSPVERYWEFVPSITSTPNGRSAAVNSPLTARNRQPRLRDFRGFIETFRWHDLDEVLPRGTGDCIDIGSGSGRHKPLVETRGYRWFGLDRSSRNALVQSDAVSLPVASSTNAAVVAWQLMEYVDRPEEVIAEAARVLEPGGVFCGSVSFLEPIHGRTYFNISSLLLEKLLRQHGFGDIQVKPGLNGFALMLWTWLRRLGIPLADRVAVPCAFLLLAPLASILFVISWVSYRLGFGAGHYMQWLSQTAPFEFAGHVLFTARKRARPENCTSRL